MGAPRPVRSGSPPHPSLWEPESWLLEGQEGPGVVGSATELKEVRATSGFRGQHSGREPGREKGKSVRAEGGRRGQLRDGEG